MTAADRAGIVTDHFVTDHFVTDPPGPAEPGRPETEPPLVDVIVLHWRNVALTIRCLQSLAHVTYPNVRLIVVDNGSGDGSADILARHMRWEYGGDVRFVQVGHETDCAPSLACLDVEEISPDPVRAVLAVSPLNRGYAGGANLGLRVARGFGGASYFWLLNNDLTVSADAIGYLVDRCRKNSSIALCGCLQLGASSEGEPTGMIVAAGGYRYLRTLGHFWHVHPGSSGPTEQEEAVEATMSGVQGAAVFGTHRFLSTVGLFEEDRFLYFEEQDWARRARTHGFRFGYAPRAIVHHAAGSGFGHGEGKPTSATSRYFMARSRIVFTRRHHPWALLTVSAYQVALIGWWVAKGQRRAGREAFLGMVDGYRRRYRTFPELGDVSYTTRPMTRRLGTSGTRIKLQMTIRSRRRPMSP
jgi:GT2 family glycosyltransferase